MDLRRLLTAASAGLMAAGFAAVALPPAAAAAAPAVPTGFTVARSTDDAHKIKVAWKAVPQADHYVVSSTAGNVESVVSVPASALSYTVDAPDACTSYKIKVGASDAAGATTSTSVWTINALTPSYVAGMATGRADEGTTLTATWRAPSWTGYTPLTGYRVVVTRASDGVVLSDRTSMETALRFPGVDPARAYTVSVGTQNEFGACNTAKSLIDRYRPNDPTGLVSQRRADAPGTVEVVWRAAVTGPAATYYTVGYGESKVTKTIRVDAPATTATLPLDVAKTWVIEVKAFNANGGSGALTGSVPVYEGGNATPSPAPSSSPAAGTDPVDQSNTTTTTVTTGTDRTPPVIVASLSQAPRNGYFAQPVTIHFSCADNSGQIAKCPADIRVATDGVAQRFSGTAIDKAGNTATITLPLNVDQVAPAISSTVLGTPSAAGWFNTPPTIRYTCSDTTSGVNTLSVCPTTLTVTGDGAAQRITGTAADKAGNTATDTVLVSLDRVAPSITATVTGDKTADGWYTSGATVHFVCSDQLSGVADCPADRTVTGEGAGQVVTGTATDRAGNIGTASVTVDVDQTAPAITPDVLGDFGVEAWFRGTPTVRFTCTDGGAGVRDCPADVPVADEGADQLITGTTADLLGNTASVTTVVSVDRTAPAITATVVGDASADGWWKTSPTVHFTCTDALSGINVCPADVEVAGTGAQVVSGTATDKAGNTATTSVTVDVDRTAPAITATVIGDPNADGWYKTLPTVHFTCADQDAGVAQCPADVPLAQAGAGQVVSGTATDKAGNTATTSVTVDVDRTAPAITATVIGDRNTDGWYKTPPTVHFTCTDDLAGLAACPADVPVTTDGAGQVVPGTATDKAGNTATTSVTVDVDLTGPAISATVDGVKNDAGWYRAAPTVRWTCTDTGSGVASCPAATTVGTAGAAIPVPGTATDRAGNSTAGSVSVNVDATAPVITVVGAANGGRYKQDGGPAVSCAAADSGSGVAAPAAITHTSTDRGVHTVTCAGAVDAAGNTAAPVTITYTVDASLSWLIALTHQYLGNAQSAAVHQEFEALLVKRQYVAYMGKVAQAAIGRKPALTATQSATLIFWALAVAIRG